MSRSRIRKRRKVFFSQKETNLEDKRKLGSIGLIPVTQGVEDFTVGPTEFDEATAVRTRLNREEDRTEM